MTVSYELPHDVLHIGTIDLTRVAKSLSPCPALQAQVQAYVQRSQRGICRPAPRKRLKSPDLR